MPTGVAGVAGGSDYNCVYLLQVQIGNADYNCSCVRYVISEYVTSEYTTSEYVTSEDDEDLGLTVGLSAVCGFLLIVIVIITITVGVICCRRRNKPCEERDAKNEEGAGSIELEHNDSYESYYSTIPEDSAYYGSRTAEPNDNNVYTALDIPNYLTLLSDDEC